MRINIGVFAHNEQDNIGSIIADLATQTLFQDQQINTKVFVLANGCTDSTATNASESINTLPPQIQTKFSLHDLQFSGKSRTWNFFTHEVCQQDPCDATIFVDADIRIRNSDTLKRMVSSLSQTPASVINSRPKKDIDITKANLSFSQKIIASSGGSFTDYKSTICGQLYAVSFNAIRNIYLPIGLPVEDGFIKAMIISTFLTLEDDKTKITGFEDIWHEYESIQSLNELIRHQTRIIIGSAINSAIFCELNKLPPDPDKRSTLLKSASQDTNWLNSIINQQLPRFPYGYVPFHFLIKRQKGIFKRQNVGLLRKVFLSTSGFAFDVMVYVSATFKLAQGKGVGYW